MNLEQTIYISCATHHGIFPNRAAVLNHLFCVNGTGYRWKNGRLIYDNDERRGKDVKTIIKKVFEDQKERDTDSKRHERNWKRKQKKNPPPPDPEAKKLVNDFVKAVDEYHEKLKTLPQERQDAIRKENEDRHKMLKRKIRLERRMRYKIPPDIDQRIKNVNFDNWYPMSEGYCRLSDFPDDIQLNWLNGLIETCLLYLSNPAKIGSYNNKQILDRNEKIVKSALDRALTLKESRYKK